MNMHIFSDWIRHRRERAELEAMSPDEVGRLAHDIGVSSNELETDGRGWSRPRTALRDAARARLRRGGAEARRARDPARHAAAVQPCETTGTCQHALDAGIAPTTYRSFCVNAATLEALKAGEAKA